jgi:ATP-dependent Clp protease ATP-binding subunit ClpB
LKKVESAFGDTNFQVLKKYGSDLVERAAKLDPVIGIDQEIERLVVILSKRNKNRKILIFYIYFKNVLRSDFLDI